jgi:hypothetical protein
MMIGTSDDKHALSDGKVHPRQDLSSRHFLRQLLTTLIAQGVTEAVGRIKSTVAASFTRTRMMNTWLSVAIG